MSCNLNKIFIIGLLLTKAMCGLSHDSHNELVKSKIRGDSKNSLTGKNAKTVRGRVLQQSSTNITFDMYNSITDIKIITLSNGTILNLNGLSIGSSLNIEAVVMGSKPGSIRLSFDFGLINKIERGSRYSLCGNSGSDFKTCNGMTLGKHTIQATAYVEKNATGLVLGSNTVQFELVDIPLSPPTTPGPIPSNPPPVPTIPLPVPTNPPPTPINPPPIPSNPTMRPATMSPINPVDCKVPKLNGTWTSWQKYPISIGEGMGAMVGKHFVVVSGFTNSFSKVTKKVYAFDTTNSTGQWQEMDDVPVPGFSHAAFAVDGLIMYICGAYVGPTPGPDTPVCLQYRHTNPPTQQWSRLPDMPDGRGGGALNHIKESNSLLYTAGATRRGSTIDFNTTWELDLDDLAAGWIVRPALPFKGNHISHVTAQYQGKYHYFVAGGQLEQKEKDGNQDDLYEWDAEKKVWIQRADMRIARGHASSSTVAYGCGFIILGGATNNGTHTDDISYYGIDTNTWIKIGVLPQPINTPVCDIVRLGPNNDWVYCQTGRVGGTYSWRTRISL